MLRVKWFGSCSLIQRSLGPTGLSGLSDSVAGISQVPLRLEFSALYALSRDNYFSGLVRRQAAPASRGRLFSASESGGEETFEWSRLGGFGSNKVGYRSGQTGQTVNLLA